MTVVLRWEKISSQSPPRCTGHNQKLRRSVPVRIWSVTCLQQQRAVWKWGQLRATTVPHPWSCVSNVHCSCSCKISIFFVRWRVINAGGTKYNRVAWPLKEYAELLEKEVSGLYLDAHAKIDQGNVICTAGYIRHRAVLCEEQLEVTIARLVSQSTDSTNPGDTTSPVVEHQCLRE